MTETIFVKNVLSGISFFLFGSRLVPYVYMESAGFINYTAPSHQIAIKISDEVGYFLRTGSFGQFVSMNRLKKNGSSILLRSNVMTY